MKLPVAPKLSQEETNLPSNYPKQKRGLFAHVISKYKDSQSSGGVGSRFSLQFVAVFFALCCCVYQLGF